VNFARTGDDQRGYVTIGGLNQVKVFRTSDFELVATISAGELSHGIWRLALRPRHHAGAAGGGDGARAGDALRAGARVEAGRHRHDRADRARFVDDRDVTTRVPAFVHDVSDFLDAAARAGLGLAQFREWWHADDVKRPPRLVTMEVRR
jgi:hypothetical protein